MSDQPLPTTASQPDASPPPTRKRRARNIRAVPPLTPTATPFLSLPTVHPLVRRHYRVATSAIEELVDLVEHCVRLLIPGALVHARPRMGKTHAIDYAALHLNRQRPELLVLRMSCEHYRTQFEGPFFNAHGRSPAECWTAPAKCSR